MADSNPLSFSIIEPYALVIDHPVELAPHLDTLEGKVIAALWNSKAEGDETLQYILKNLVDQYGVKETLFFKKKSSSGPAKADQLDAIWREADAFVTGIGD
jgi:hypothetical protein